MIIQVNINEKKRGTKTTIKDFHFNLYPGETTIVIGTSGAGKSTMVECITGQTNYDGSISGITTDQISYVRQHITLNPLETVSQAIYYSGRFDHPFEKKSVVQDETDKYISILGLDYVRNNRVSNLSGGQSKRTSIACELIRKNVKLLILDEPDSGLDCGTARALANHIKEITEKNYISSVVISHNVSNIDLYDNLLVIAKDDEGIGRIAYFGKKNKALAFFGCQEYYQILNKINLKAEEGEGIAQDFIDKYNNRKGVI